MMSLRGYPITFSIYAENETEAQEARQAIIKFIGEHAQQGRAVTGRKIADALSRWEKNPIVRTHIINFFK